MTRRLFLQALAAQRRPPNILLLLADNWAWPHASAYGHALTRTPTFDRLARQGVLFTNAFAPTPSCSPSRAGILTGQATHRLEDAASLHSLFPSKFPVYTDSLAAAGYRTGHTGKGWGPGDFVKSARKDNPAGPVFRSFGEFLGKAGSDPFCFWLGSRNPHVPWDSGEKRRASKDPAAVRVPAYLPDHPDVRADIVDYACEVEEFDAECAAAIAAIEKAGHLDNTLIVMTSDNGWQMPRGLANVYDSGVRIPMAMRWGTRWGGKRCGDFVTTTDLAPTFLEAAGVKPMPGMTAQSLLPLLHGAKQKDRDCVFLERERHANVRSGDAGYPVRAIRTNDFLYVRNLRPDRWPAGDPQLWHSVGPYGDVDPCRSKTLLMERGNEPNVRAHFHRIFGKRPAEELYELREDPDQIRNLATDSRFTAAKNKLRARLEQWQRSTADPRIVRDTDDFDRMPYLGPGAPAPAK